MSFLLPEILVGLGQAAEGAALPWLAGEVEKRIKKYGQQIEDIDSVGDIWDLVKDYTNNETFIPNVVQAGKDFIREIGKKTPSWPSGNATSQAQKKPRITDGGKKANQKDPDPGDEKQEPEDSLPMAHTAFSNTRCCVDLGEVNLNKYGKGGSRGDYFNSEDVISQVYISQFNGGSYLSNLDTKKFSDLPQNRDMNVRLPSNINANTVLNHWEYTTEDNRPFGFNSVHQLEKVKFVLTAQAAAAAVGGVSGFQEPVNANTVTDTLVDLGNAKDLVCLMNQSMIVRMKNTHKKATDDAGENSVGQIYITIKAMKAKHDIYPIAVSTPPAATQFSQDLIAAGFEDYYADSTSVLQHPEVGNTRLPQSLFQFPHESWKRNKWFNDNWQCVDTKSFCLCPGQESHLRYKLTKPQILSYNYSSKAQYQSATLAKPVLFKKGEIQLFLSFEGGLAPYSQAPGDPENIWRPRIEPTQMLVMVHHQYEAKKLPTSEGNEARRLTQFIPGGTIHQDDLDVANVFQST